MSSSWRSLLTVLTMLGSFGDAHAFGKPKPRPSPTPVPTATATPTPTSAPTPTPSPTQTSAPVFSSDEQIREAVRRAYLAILQRSVDPSGAVAYFDQIKNEGLAGWKSGLHKIADSGEFRDNVRPNKTDAQILESIYRYFLLRGVDPSGYQAYLPMIAAGRTGDVAEAVGASAEFFEAIKRPLTQPTPTPTPTPTGGAPVVTLLSGPGEYTNQTTTTFTFTGSGDAPLKFECSMDELAGGAVETCTSPQTYSGLTDGSSRSFRVYAIDRHGRRSAAATRRFMVDTSAPVVNLTGMPPDTTQSTSAEFHFGGDDSKSGIKGFECKLDSGTFQSCSSPKSYSGLSTGLHSFRVRVSDNAGNVSALAGHTWTIQAAPQPTPTPTPTAAGPLVPFGGSQTLANASGVLPIRFPDVAYDSINDVYLVVSGNNMTGGMFISGSGVPIGGPFQINQTAAWTQGQKVGFSPETNTYLVTWFYEIHGYGPVVHGRLLKYESGGPRFITSEFRIGDTGAHQEHPGSIVYSPVAREFITGWQAVAGANNEIRARRISAEGGLLGSEIVVAGATGAWQSDPAFAYHPERNEYFVAYTGEAGGAAVYGQRIQPGTGSLLGPRVLLAQAGGTWIPDVEYLPATGQYFLSWYQGGVYGKLINFDGSAAGNAFAILPGYGSYDCFDTSYNPVSQTLGGVFCGPSYEIWAAEINPYSGTVSGTTEVTNTGPQKGNFYPRMSSHTGRAEWLAVSSHDYSRLTVQRIGRR